MSPVTYPTRCPYCQNEHSLRFVYSPANLARLLIAGSLYTLLLVGLEILDDPPLPLPYRWICRNCRATFRACPGQELASRKHLQKCGRCDYDLRATATGRCPECGCKIPW